MDLSSGFSHLFTSNHAPSEGEIKSIEQKISALEQKIDTINATNLELPRLKRERQAHLGLLSATRRIPVDVVGEVLIFAIGGSALTSRDRKRVTDLCLVSRTWREAAVVTHCLWVSYELKMPCHPQDCEYAESWLKRSGCMAKILSIDYPPDSSVFKYWALSTLNLIKFLKEGPTLQTIVISCDSPSPLRNLMQGLWTPTPRESLPWASVKFFRVDVRTDWEEHGQSGRTSTFLQYLPPIPSFHLDIPSFRPESDHGMTLHIPQQFLIQLTAFTFGCDWDIAKLLKVLQHCENLVTLTLDFKAHDLANPLDDEWLDSIYAPDNNIILPCLQTLRLRRLPLDGLEISGFIQLPALSTLDISFDVGADGTHTSATVREVLDMKSGQFADDLVDFLQRSSCRILHFRLHAVKLGADDLESILQSEELSSLSRLTLDKVDIPSSFFDALSIRLDTGLPLVDLAHIELFHLPYGFSVHPVQAYAQTRKVLSSVATPTATTNLNEPLPLADTHIEIK